MEDQPPPLQQLRRARTRAWPPTQLQSLLASVRPILVCRRTLGSLFSMRARQIPSDLRPTPQALHIAILAWANFSGAATKLLRARTRVGRNLRQLPTVRCRP